jgi:hypothetical protein
MVGKLHKSWPGGHVYVLVAVDKFTKWVEAAPVITQDSKAAINFIKSIVFRFGVPHSIITRQWYKFHIKGVQGLLRKIGNQIEICICSTSEDKQASQKSQWPNMQWDKEMATGTP